MSDQSFQPMPRDPMELAKEIFDKAIAAGFLSNDVGKNNYAGLFMFMGISNEHTPRVQFKHRDLRCYVLIPAELL